MASKDIKGAAIASGVAVLLVYYWLPSYTIGTYFEYSLVFLLSFEWWQIWGGIFLLFLFQAEIFNLLGQGFQVGLMAGGTLLFAISSYFSNVKPIMWIWKKKEKGIHGNASFMSRWDMWRYWFNDRNHGWSIGNKSLPREEGADGDTTYSGLLVLGPPRVCKSTAIAIMSILRFILKKGVHSKERGEVNLFINDPSGELFDKTSQAAESIGGYEVFRLCTNAEDRAKSIRINPLEWCKDITDVGTLAGMIVAMQEGSSTSSTAKHFSTGAKTVLTAILTTIWMEAPKYRNLPNAYRLLLAYSSDKETLGKVIEQALSTNETLRLQWTAVQQRPEKEFGSILGTAENALAFTGDPTIAFLLSGNDLSLDDLRNKKMVLYNQFDENDKHFKPVNTLLLSHAFGRCMKKRTKQDTLYRPVMFFLEECYTLGYIPSLSEFAGNCRKYKCALLLIFQGLGQLQTVYKSEAAAVLDGVRSMVIFRGLNAQYYEQIEKTIGYRTEKDANGQERQVPLMSVQDMEKMPRNQCIIKMAGESAIKTKFKPYFEIPYYERMVKLGAVEQSTRDINDIPYLDFSHNIENDIIDGFQDQDSTQNRDPQNVGQQPHRNIQQHASDS